MKRASNHKSPTLNIIYLRIFTIKEATEVTIPMNDIHNEVEGPIEAPEALVLLGST